MWIRSQDKTRLLKVNYVRVNGNCVEAIHGDMLCTLIAEYSTEEKALKVLDMIQEHINSGGRVFCIDQQKGDFGYTATFEKKLGVFQMPQDEEV